jgi:hypothetical protein
VGLRRFMGQNLVGQVIERRLICDGEVTQGLRAFSRALSLPWQFAAWLAGVLPLWCVRLLMTARGPAHRRALKYLTNLDGGL